MDAKKELEALYESGVLNQELIDQSGFDFHWWYLSMQQRATRFLPLLTHLEYKKAFMTFNAEIADPAPSFVSLYDAESKEMLRSVNYFMSQEGTLLDCEILIQVTQFIALDRTLETTHLIFGDFNHPRAFGVLKQALEYIVNVCFLL